MKIFHSISEFTSTTKTIVTIGTFDGVHLGHRKIIRQLVRAAAELGQESAILTFFPHPRMVLHDSEIRLLNTMAEKINLLKGLGLRNLIIHPFSEDFARLTAVEFVSNVLVSQLNISEIIIGHDHRFGRDRSADINDLTVLEKNTDLR